MDAPELLTIDDFFRELDIVKNCRGILQGPHHSYDVYDHIDHCFRTILAITKDPHETVAARLHDTGKPKTRRILLKEDGFTWYRREDSKVPYYTFPGHEFEGAKLVRELDSNLFTSLNLDQTVIANLVAHHYLPMRHIKAMREQVNFDGFRWEFDLLVDALDRAPVTKEAILTLFYADKIAQGESCIDKAELFAIRALLLGEKSLDLRAIYDLQQKTYHSQRD